MMPRNNALVTRKCIPDFRRRVKLYERVVPPLKIHMAGLKSELAIFIDEVTGRSGLTVRIQPQRLTTTPVKKQPLNYSVVERLLRVDW